MGSTWATWTSSKSNSNSYAYSNHDKHNTGDDKRLDSFGKPFPALTTAVHFLSIVESPREVLKVSENTENDFLEITTFNFGDSIILT